MSQKVVDLRLTFTFSTNRTWKSHVSRCRIAMAAGLTSRLGLLSYYSRNIAALQTELCERLNPDTHRRHQQVTKSERGTLHAGMPSPTSHKGDTVAAMAVYWVAVQAEINASALRILAKGKGTRNVGVRGDEIPLRFGYLPGQLWSYMPRPALPTCLLACSSCLSCFRNAATFSRSAVSFANLAPRISSSRRA